MQTNYPPSLVVQRIVATPTRQVLPLSSSNPKQGSTVHHQPLAGLYSVTASLPSHCHKSAHRHPNLHRPEEPSAAAPHLSPKSLRRLGTRQPSRRPTSRRIAAHLRYPDGPPSTPCRTPDAELRHPTAATVHYIVTHPGASRVNTLPSAMLAVQANPVVFHRYSQAATTAPSSSEITVTAVILVRHRRLRGAPPSVQQRRRYARLTTTDICGPTSSVSPSTAHQSAVRRSRLKPLPALKNRTSRRQAEDDFSPTRPSPQPENPTTPGEESISPYQAAPPVLTPPAPPPEPPFIASNLLLRRRDEYIIVSVNPQPRLGSAPPPIVKIVQLRRSGGRSTTKHRPPQRPPTSSLSPKPRRPSLPPSPASPSPEDHRRAATRDLHAEIRPSCIALSPATLAAPPGRRPRSGRLLTDRRAKSPSPIAKSPSPHSPRLLCFAGQILCFGAE